jgi:diguanylate cyclase (GGDEF)-like protein
MLYVFAACLAILIMLTIRIARQQAYLSEKKLLHASRHDSLTGVCNRGYLTELGGREVALAKRYGRSLALAMIDIDHFKIVNDTFGHEVGDRAIKILVDVCQPNLRSIDHFGRLGGEEFVCILPETDLAEALTCAERMRTSVENVGLETRDGPFTFTISIGVAVLGPSQEDFPSLLKSADDALYRAKKGGRNLVMTN